MANSVYGLNLDFPLLLSFDNFRRFICQAALKNIHFPGLIPKHKSMNCIGNYCEKLQIWVKISKLDNLQV